MPTVTATGHFTVTATGSVDWRFPVVHAETAWGDLPVEVVTDENGRLLGARLRERTIPENGVSVNYEIWGVTAQISEPLPVVVLHHGSMHEGNTEFHYAIDPPDYPALGTDMVFSENGHDVLVATTLGAGDGTVTLGPGEFFTDPAAPHTVRMRLNHGWGWWMGSELVRMGMGYERQALPVVDLSIVDVLVEEEDGSSVSVLGDEFDVKVKGEAKVEYRITASACQASVQASKLKVRFDPGNEAHRDFYLDEGAPIDPVSQENDPELISPGLYEYSWDGRDDTDDKRILLGGKFLVSVEVDLLVTGLSVPVTVSDLSDSVWQEIAKPHASNYGQYYPYVPGLPSDSTPSARLARSALTEFGDGTGFTTLPESVVLSSDASMALAGLTSRDAVMSFGGHSGPGNIQFCVDKSIPNFGGMSNLATTPNAIGGSTLPTSYLSSLPNGALDDVFLVVLLGCNTATPAGDTSTLRGSLLSLGVDVVIAFPGYLHDTLAKAWAKEFWCIAKTGHRTGLNDCSYWDLPGVELPDNFICNSASGELPSIEEAAICASAFVLADHPKWEEWKRFPFKNVEIKGHGKTETLAPARYGAAPSH